MLQKISLRERQVLTLIAYEHTNADIAQKLNISAHTVKSHRKNLLEKLSAKNTAGLVRRGFELGLLKINYSHVYGNSIGEMITMQHPVRSKIPLMIQEAI